MGGEIVFIIVPKIIVEENGTYQYINNIIDKCSYPDQPITIAVNDLHDIYNDIKTGYFSSFYELSKEYGFKAPSISNAYGHSAHIVYSYFDKNISPSSTQDGFFNNLLNKFMGEEKNSLLEQETPATKDNSNLIMDNDIINIKKYMETHDILKSSIIISDENDGGLTPLPGPILIKANYYKYVIDYKNIFNQHIDDYLVAIKWYF